MKLTRGEREFKSLVIGVLIGLIILSIFVGLITNNLFLTSATVISNIIGIVANAKQLIEDTTRYPIKEGQ